MDAKQLLIILLSLAAASGAAYFLIFPFLSGEAKGDKRQAQMLSRKPAARSDRQADRRRAASRWWKA